MQALSEDIELIKCLSDIICRVCKIKHIVSVIRYTLYVAVCFQFTHFLCDDWGIYIYILCVIIIIRLEVWTITHCLGLGHETMLWAVIPTIDRFVPANIFYWNPQPTRKIYLLITKAWLFYSSMFSFFFSCLKLNSFMLFSIDFQKIIFSSKYSWHQSNGNLSYFQYRRLSAVHSQALLWVYKVI